MGKGQRSKKRLPDRGQAAADVLAASRLAEEKRFDEAIPLLRQALEAADSPALRSALGDCLLASGHVDEARAEYRRAAPRHAGASGRLGLLVLAEGKLAEAVSLLRDAGSRDPRVCLARAYAELQLSRWSDAEQSASEAVRALPAGAPEHEEAALYAALAMAARGDLSGAALRLRPATSRRARSLSARFELLGGDLARAVSLFDDLDREGVLGAEDLSHAALAAGWSGHPERARGAAARARREAPGVATQLAGAQVALAGHDPTGALESLPPKGAAIPDPTDAAMARVLRARAQRQLGQPAGLIDALATLGAEVPPRVRALGLLEAGHAQADAGEFEKAAGLFEAALRNDPGLQEATQARDLAQQRLTWKRDLEAGAGRAVGAARAEAEALRRTFAERETGIEVLKRQLADLDRQRRVAEAAAAESRAQAEEARAEVEGQRQALLRDELSARDAEVLEKTEAELRRAFGDGVDQVPRPMLEIVRQAERMYQKGLQTDLPGAGVAVLYCGALERALYLTIVSELDAYLDRTGARDAFLTSGRTADRSGRPTYVDHFVGAFDRAHPQRAPGLGEVARVLRRRTEPHLVVFRSFLEQDRGWSAPFLDALGAYLDEVKARLRDPVAHGRVLDISEREVIEPPGHPSCTGSREDRGFSSVSRSLAE